MITKGKITWDDGTPVVGYRVEVLDSDIGPDDFVGATTTDGSGNYSLDHKKRQDPKWYGKKKRKGDFYIKVRKPENRTFRTVYRSKVYQDYAPRTLTINVVLNRIIVNYGINTVFGKVLAKYPDGHTEPLGGAKVIVKDEDVRFDDTLDSVVVGDDGRFIATFSKSDYDPWFEIGEGLPDILVEVKKKLRGDWHRIWRTKTFSESSLPLEVNIEVPAIFIKGKVKSYKTCENGQLVDKPVTDLVARAWDFNSVQSKHYLGESPVEDPPKVTVGIFRIWIFGSRDRPYNMSNGSDIFVQLVDKYNSKIEAWRSRKHLDVVNPTVIDINNGNPIEATVECEEPEELPPQGTGGTIARIINRCGETRYLYQDNAYIAKLSPDRPEKNVNVPCRQITRLQAKETISDSYNPVTWAADVPGACYEEPLKVLYEIWY